MTDREIAEKIVNNAVNAEKIVFGRCATSLNFRDSLIDDITEALQSRREVPEVQWPSEDVFNQWFEALHDWPTAKEVYDWLRFQIEGNK